MQNNAGLEEYGHAVKRYGSRRVFTIKLLGNFSGRFYVKDIIPSEQRNQPKTILRANKKKSC